MEPDPSYTRCVDKQPIGTHQFNLNFSSIWGQKIMWIINGQLFFKPLGIKVADSSNSHECHVCSCGGVENNMQDTLCFMASSESYKSAMVCISAEFANRMCNGRMGYGWCGRKTDGVLKRGMEIIKALVWDEDIEIPYNVALVEAHHGSHRRPNYDTINVMQGWEENGEMISYERHQQACQPSPHDLLAQLTHHSTSTADGGDVGNHEHVQNGRSNVCFLSDCNGNEYRWHLSTEFLLFIVWAGLRGEREDGGGCTLVFRGERGLLCSRVRPCSDIMQKCTGRSDSLVAWHVSGLL